MPPAGQKVLAVGEEEDGATEVEGVTEEGLEMAEEAACEPAGVKEEAERTVEETC